MLTEIITDIITDLLSLLALFSVLYVGSYFIELARQKVRRKLRVCDNCFEMVKRMKGE